jgi:hypothetical protein
VTNENPLDKIQNLDYNSCIVVKGKQFMHQPVYDGDGDKIHCIFCQRRWLSLKVYWEEREKDSFIGAGI